MFVVYTKLYELALDQSCCFRNQRLRIPFLSRIFKYRNLDKTYLEVLLVSSNHLIDLFSFVIYLESRHLRRNHEIKII